LLNKLTAISSPVANQKQQGFFFLKTLTIYMQQLKNIVRGKRK